MVLLSIGVVLSVVSLAVKLVSGEVVELKVFVEVFVPSENAVVVVISSVFQK